MFVEAQYAGVTFKSRLHARWAAFFDLANWKWAYQPLELVGWSPDFLVSWSCGHSECNGNHSLLVTVLPTFSLGDFKGHPCLDYPYGRDDSEDTIPADAGAAFGINTDVTYWEMAHGAGGGEDSVDFWVPDHRRLWILAGNAVSPSDPVTASSPRN
ncbi:hypothetical protein GobsT_18390 [Gemmata obscuriglobus]|uniref:hypothetical protein n=1 Tax=Gemmata obscuriglobus TaxID=114 RepID=UPI00016C5407|nr:hypothetical protein [Gemmata obscuriglobus]QEG27086.1 hypothetical protein GobsT_18390 [Gemmata obscuriglobus]VTS03553.1 Uncharacterized protein OS=Sinorhizobium meliloti (strain SM11) GN=SM11_pC0082 PE=4 SV=1 [Gemmata obscuriglobus UQM 2246]